MDKKTIKAAEEVLNIFPDMGELLNSDRMYELIQHKIVSPLIIIAYKDTPWEGIATAVNNMCYGMQERPFYEGYAFMEGDPDAHAMVLPAYGEAIKIDDLTVFKALLTIMFCSWLEIGVFSHDQKWHKDNRDLAIKQNDARLRFLDSNMDIYKILD